MDDTLNTDWKSFKKELHKAIEKYGAENVALVCNTAIYATVGGKAATRRYDKSILTEKEIKIWRHELGLHQG